MRRAVAEGGGDGARDTCPKIPAGVIAASMDRRSISARTNMRTAHVHESAQRFHEGAHP
jgi:hypothetical protein